MLCIHGHHPLFFPGLCWLVWPQLLGIQCMDCHTPHMESNRNLFRLRDAPLSKSGEPLESIVAGVGFNYYYWEDHVRNAPNNERGHDWCYTCHLVDSDMSGKGECVGGGHAHGSAKF